MKRTLLLLIIISSSGLIGQIRGTTQTGRLIPVKEKTQTIAPDVTGPVITLKQPVQEAGRELIIKERSLAVILEVHDSSGTGDVLINGTKAAQVNQSQFFLNLKLVNGMNRIEIKAYDRPGNMTEKVFSVRHISDQSGPIVRILEPAIQRGITAVRKSETLRIKGLAIDESGVLDVKVNGIKTALQPDGEFSADLFLNVGENAVTVIAEDNLNNITADTFMITRQAEELITSGKYYALIIGIDKYKGAWPELRNAVNDARAVAGVLKSDYRFDELITMYNEEATRENIIKKFEELAETVTQDDNLLIFYSGHGEYNQQFNKGYWVPVNAASRTTADYVSNSDIQTFLTGIRSRHTVLISDACFSGDIFRGKAQELPFEEGDRYYKEVYRRASRCALTSGGIEPVADGGREGHSVFTYYLLKALKGNSSRYFTAGQLFKEIEIPVANNSEQTPVYQPIKNTGDEGGQFIFVKAR